MKKQLSYLSRLLFAITLFLGYSVTVNAEEITPTEIRSQIRTIYTDGTTQWYKSDNNTYTTPLYFGTGPSYSTYGVPCNFRLLVVDNIDTQYSYKYSYDMHIFTPYSTSNTWDSSKIDNQYDISVGDDQGVVKDSKCTIVNTTKNTNVLGTFMNKSVSCVFTVNKNQSNAYISAGYFCKGNCNLTNMEPLGYIPQDSYLSIDNVKIERFNDNSNIIIDQNQTIIDQNNTTNEKLDDVQQSIIDSNKETQDVIKDQFNECKQSENLINYNNFSNINSNTSINIINNGLIIIKANNSNGYGIYSETLTLKPNTTYTISSNSNWEIQKPNNWGWRLYNVTDENFSNISKNDILTFTTNNNTQYILYYYIGSPNTDIGQVTLSNIMLNEGSSPKSYQPYGKEICSNKLDDVNNTSKGIWETLKSIPNLILEGIKGLFVPSKEELQSLIDEFKQIMENKLGAIYQVSDMLIDVFRSIFNPTERNSCITFPEIKDPMFNKLIIEQTDYCFDSLRTDFDFLFTISDMIISIVCTLAFGNMLYKKYEGFIGGDTSDY